MTELQKLAIVAHRIGASVQDGRVYFYGDRYKSYSLDEVVETTIVGESPQYCKFSIVRDGYTGEQKTIAELSPKLRFEVTKGEGWNASFVCNDRRDAVNYLNDIPLNQRVKFCIVEIQLENPFDLNELPELPELSVLKLENCKSLSDFSGFLDSVGVANTVSTSMGGYIDVKGDILMPHKYGADVLKKYIK